MKLVFIALAILLIAFAGCSKKNEPIPADQNVQSAKSAGQTEPGNQADDTAIQKIPENPDDSNAGSKDTIIEDQTISEETEDPVSIDFISVPAVAKPDSNFEVSWKVNSQIPSNITRTAVYYGTESNQELDEEADPKNSGYAEMTKDFTEIPSKIPSVFRANVNAGKGTGNIYLRALAVYNGQNYWTDEKTVSVAG